MVKLPQSPSQIGTRFNLFTRNNRNSTTLIDDHNINKLTASHFKISRRTILVIHGFTGKGKRWWRGGGRGWRDRTTVAIVEFQLFISHELQQRRRLIVPPPPSITPETRSSPLIHLKRTICRTILSNFKQILLKLPSIKEEVPTCLHDKSFHSRPFWVNMLVFLDFTSLFYEQMLICEILENERYKAKVMSFIPISCCGIEVT